MDHLIEELKEQHEEEAEDMEKYLRLAKCAEEHREYELAFMLNLIANDEESHKKYLHEYLEKHAYHDRKKEHLS